MALNKKKLTQKKEDRKVLLLLPTIGEDLDHTSGRGRR
jgi:hypothetical protein